MIEIPKIWLADRNVGIVNEWKKMFAGVSNVTITHCNDICDILPLCKVVVSPSNSFGVMDGGIDLTYTRFYGENLGQQLRTKIASDHFGELPVGQATYVPINDTQCLVSAPTMRVPQIVAKTDNAYLAFRATLVCCLTNNLEGPVLVPGLCTAIGRMPAAMAAKQMRLAYDSILYALSNPGQPLSLGQATRNHLSLLDLDTEYCFPCVENSGD